MKGLKIFLIGALLAMSNGYSMSDFEVFLNGFIEKVAVKELQANKLMWIAETTSAQDAFDLLTTANVELSLMFADKGIYEQLVKWKKENTIKDPILLRQLDDLIRKFKVNMIPKELIEKISAKETEIMRVYNTFKPKFNGKSMSEHEIIDVLKKEKNVEVRKEVWALSKEIGEKLSSLTRDVAKLRNEQAHMLGYRDFFQMSLELQEIDENWLFTTFNKLYEKSNAAYIQVIQNINSELSNKYKVKIEELGPWAFSEPFCQEDPIESTDLDDLLKNKDMVELSKQFYSYMGFDIEDIIKRSDLFERENKNQHAFCISIDRKKDVRTLQNVKPTIRYMDTLLHEFGHAVYDLGYNEKMPWLLRTHPSNPITTEAMALFAGRQAYTPLFLNGFLKVNDKIIAEKAKNSQKRKQLLFSRWVLVITNFEKEFYKDPDQDLNALWWNLVEKYQMIKAPQRKGKQDWAAKYHISMAPVYYHCYLIGEVFASSLDNLFIENTNRIGKILKEKLFFSGDSIPWDKTIENMLNKPFNLDSWLKQYAQ